MKCDAPEAVWKALSDPTRRRILDALREEPQTTGALCRPFKLSRFAVMKHLGVLEEAGLVVVRRQGRERWNHLNAVPIQQVYERWVRPFAASWATNLVRLKDCVETSKGARDMTAKAAANFGVVEIELEIPIHGEAKRVWKALVEETTEWWSKDFYATPSAKRFVIEPKLGGRAYEDGGDGAGLTWYTVMGVEPGKSITMQGWLTPAFGGPAATILELRLNPSGKKTVLQLSDTIFGRVGDEKLAQTREGWVVLFEQGLKRHVEGK